MERKYHLAIDIGASSGKALVGYFDYENNRLESEVIYRFPNWFVLKDGHKIWDLNHLFAEVKNTIKEALKKYPKIETMSIDTWGCDYVLLDKDDKEILPCYSYRDERTLSILDEAFSLISKREIFNLTGSQFQSFNTIFQLYKDKVERRLEKAENFLMIPEYLTFKLTGVKVHELTNASTTSLLEKDKYEYSKTIIGKLNLPEKLFKNPAKVGYFVGNLLNEVEKEVGGNIKVKLCATHDTASAIRLIEDKIDENTLYLSSGTWSLLGVKLNHYLVNKKVFDNNFSNELGKNYIRFQKNIMGLWIIQNLIREMNLEIVEAIELAKTSKENNIKLDVNNDRFLSTNNMKEEILSYLNENGFQEKFSDADLINIVFVSLACSYKTSIKEIENMLKRKFNKLVILGGGAKNKYLNDLIRKICDLKVETYPYECSALGNLLSQIED